MSEETKKLSAAQEIIQQIAGGTLNKKTDDELIGYAYGKVLEIGEPDEGKKGANLTVEFPEPVGVRPDVWVKAERLKAKDAPKVGGTYEFACYKDGDNGRIRVRLGGGLKEDAARAVFVK